MYDFDVQRDGLSWGDGPINLGVPSYKKDQGEGAAAVNFPLEAGTMRGVLLALIALALEEDDEGELEVWERETAGVPFWAWLHAWAKRRPLVLKARRDGYAHEGADVSSYVHDQLAPAHGPPDLLESPDGNTMLFTFPDESWVAFRRSGKYRVGAFDLEQPDCWRQLEERPALQQDGPAERKVGGAAADLEAVLDRLAEPLKFTVSLDDDDDDDLPGRPPSVQVARRIVVTCDYPDCASSYTGPVDHWPPSGGVTCRTCNTGTVSAKPCGFTGHKATAADLPGRPGYPAKWVCSCGHPDVFHVGYTIDHTEPPFGCVECGDDCPDFAPPGGAPAPAPTSSQEEEEEEEEPARSICVGCGHQHAWGLGPGVEAVCDYCGNDRLMRPFLPVHDTGRVPLPEGRVACENECGHWAQVKFKRKGATHTKMAVCGPCSKLKEVAGRRRGLVEL